MVGGHTFLILSKPQEKIKSWRSGDLGDRCIVLRIPIHLLGKQLFKDHKQEVQLAEMDGFAGIVCLHLENFNHFLFQKSSFCE